MRRAAHALWAVRILDAWALKHKECWSVRAPIHSYEPWDVVLGWNELAYHEALTPADARTAAAESLIAVDPSLGDT